MIKTNIKINNTTDNFAWLEKDTDKTNKWLDLEQKITTKYLRTSDKRVYLNKELKKLFQIDGMQAPVIRGNLYFFNYRKANEDQYSIYQKIGQSGKPKLVLGYKTIQKMGGTLSSWSITENARFISLHLSPSSNDNGFIKIYDIQKKKLLKDYIPAVLYPYFSAWNRNSKGFWYVMGTNKTPGNEKYYKSLFYHNLGDDITDDKVVFSERKSKADWPMLFYSQDGEHALVNLKHEDDTTTIYYKNLKSDKSKFINISGKIIGDNYAVPGDKHIFMLTDNKAPNRKILSMNIQKIDVRAWKTEVKEKTYKIEDWKVTKEFIFLNYLENVNSKLVAYNIGSKLDKEIKLPDIGSVVSLSSRIDYKDLYLSFSSFNTPLVIYKLSLSTLKYEQYWKSSSPINPNQIKIDQIWVKSNDGTRIPIFRVYKKNLKINKNTPTLVYAYGGFNVSVTPGYIASIQPFIKSGGVFISANIRGGGEFGKKWHESAIKGKRHKAFEDFSSILKYLTDNNLSSPEKICIWGASNGGLLMSVMMTRYPDLFKCAVVQVPVTDMLKFHLFNGGRWWINDYGDPENSKMRKYLSSYSPYHNVKDFNYPTAFFVTARHDDRVHPMHSFKMVARLKANKNQINPILLRAEKKAGHSGGGKVSSYIEQYTDIFTFIFRELGL